jgi:hypothetical protein
MAEIHVTITAGKNVHVSSGHGANWTPIEIKVDVQTHSTRWVRAQWQAEEERASFQGLKLFLAGAQRSFPIWTGLKTPSAAEMIYKTSQSFHMHIVSSNAPLLILSPAHGLPCR